MCPVATPAIYVELRIRAPFEALWQYTQNPDLHKRWDLRFTDIKYLPKENESDPHQFTYETRIGFGRRIAGTGESVGTHDTPTTSTSALKFFSDDPLSLIREGSGYWKYIKTDDGIRFLTLYDYRTRGGAIGVLFDRIIFRPTLGWATAWSFDRLRLWLDQGVDPAISVRMSVIHCLCRFALTFIWIWHGLVPKIIVSHQAEIDFLLTAGLFEGREKLVTAIVGVGEIIYGLMHLLLWRARVFFVIDSFAFIVLGVGALIIMPDLIGAPFSPMSLTVAIVTIAIVGWMSAHNLPSASRCLRHMPREQS